MSEPNRSAPVVLVAGASRGVGRGIARALGQAGATVIVTGRSSEAGPRTDSRLETIEDTAREVTAAGGTGHPYVCDMTREREVDALAAWVLRRFGALDAAVSSVWSGYEGFDGERFPDGSAWGTPFWRRPTGQLGRLLEGGLFAGLLLARAVAPAMVAAKRGLLVQIAYDPPEGHVGDIHVDLAQAAMRRLALGLARDLSGTGVTALALSPGRVRTERAMEAGQAEEGAQSPLLTGRAVMALLRDPAVARHAGALLRVADLVGEGASDTQA